MPNGIKLYFENQFRNFIVDIFSIGVSIGLIIFFSLKSFLMFFSNSFQTIPVIFDLPKGTTTYCPTFNFLSLSYVNG